jgi:predicted permease
MRFSLGPAILQQQPQTREVGDTLPQHAIADEGTPLLPTSRPRSSFTDMIKSLPIKVAKSIWAIWNPPLTGALLAVLVGIIPPIKHEFYHEEGFFYGTVTTSLTNIGELFTALMLFVLGASLQLKAQGDSRIPILVLIYIYIMRFFVMPAIAIVVVWKISDWGWLDDDAHQGLGGDPMMKFIMCLIPAGPPYSNKTY